MRILIAVDYGLFGEAQVELLRNYRYSETMQVKVVHVIEPLAWQFHTAYPTIMPLTATLMKERKESAAKLVQDVVSRLKETWNEMQVELEVREGNPAEEILQAASDWNADLIVVGSHGRTGMEKFLLGSVSGAVSTHASCSVLIARRKEGGESD